MVTRVLLIRHAATETGGRLCGSLDIPLSSDGLMHLGTIVRRLDRAGAPDALFTSTLRRATEVARAIGDIWGVPPEPVDWAREIHCGQVEGASFEQLQEDWPELWARNQAQTDDSFAWPGGETYAGFRARILRGLDATTAAHSGQRVAIVTHAGVISQVLGVIRGRPASVWAADRPGPLTGTEVSWRNGGPTVVVRYNDPHWYRGATRRA